MVQHYGRWKKTAWASGGLILESDEATIQPSQLSRHEAQKQKAIVGALAVFGMFLTAGATLYAPQTRAPIYEPHRVKWPEFRGDLRRRKAFRRTVRMSEAIFVKLADLLRPAIQENERFGSEYHVMYPGTWCTST